MRRRILAVPTAFASLRLGPAPSSARDLPDVRKDGTLRVLVVPVERELECVDLSSDLTVPPFETDRMTAA